MVAGRCSIINLYIWKMTAMWSIIWQWTYAWQIPSTLLVCTKVHINNINSTLHRSEIPVLNTFTFILKIVHKITNDNNRFCAHMETGKTIKWAYMFVHHSKEQCRWPSQYDVPSITCTDPKQDMNRKRIALIIGNINLTFLKFKIWMLKCEGMH